MRTSIQELAHKLGLRTIKVERIVPKNTQHRVKMMRVAGAE